MDFTRILSPVATNSGTFTITPFSSFAGFDDAVFVAVFITGFVSNDRQRHRVRQTHADRTPVVELSLDLHPRLHPRRVVAERFLFHLDSDRSSSCS